MKKNIIFLVSFIIFSVSLLGQTTVKNDDLKKVKTVKSELDEEVKVEIRKPDNSSIMPRKDSKLDNDMKLNVIDKFKKSNKLLY